MTLRAIYCTSCSEHLGYVSLESVWEENDEKTYKLIHPLCSRCAVDCA